MDKWQEEIEKVNEIVEKVYLKTISRKKQLKKLNIEEATNQLPFLDTNSPDYYELLDFYSKELSELTQEKPEYIIYPPHFEVKFNYRLKKYNPNTNSYDIIPIDKMTEQEKNLIRKSDIKRYGQSYLLEDVEMRRKHYKQMEEMRERLNIVLLPYSRMEKEKARIYRRTEKGLVKVPFAFMTQDEFNYVCWVESEINGSDKKFLDLYFKALEDRERLEKLYGKGAFYEYKSDYKGINEVWYFIDNKWIIVRKFLKPKYYNDKRILVEVEVDGEIKERIFDNFKS